MDSAGGNLALPKSLQGFSVHLVGIKGTGMTALADVLRARGANVTGSDTTEVFYTDGILSDLGIPVKQGFSAANLPPLIDLVIYSVAYDPEIHPELVAARRRNLELRTYPEVLGGLSRLGPCVGVSGIHGKSTTTAMAGSMIADLCWPGTVLVGTAVPSFGGRSALTQGDEFTVLEACEYRRSFLNYQVDCGIITNVELDHPDYYDSAEAVADAFVEWGENLSPQATLLHSADDPGAVSVARRIGNRRDDLEIISYGVTGRGPLRLTDLQRGAGQTRFRVEGFDVEFTLGLPGEHNVLNAVAALGAVLYLKDHQGLELDEGTVQASLRKFTGTRRRTEVVGQRKDVLVVDDYGHHPTAIQKTLEGLREFYPGRRIVLDFMSHTFSRTGALLEEFAGAFGAADHVILHKIYASAREQNPQGVTGENLYKVVSSRHPSVVYYPEPMDALPHLESFLRTGDVLVTMGAGDNWKVGYRYLGKGDPQ